MSTPWRNLMSDKYEEFKYHGGPFDRGGADSYYRRPRSPHKWPEGTMNGKRVGYGALTPAEREAYNAGYDENEARGDFKDWGYEPPESDDWEDPEDD